MPVAFVAGATGYTGREVVRALRERGVQTVAHVRPDSSRRAEWASRFAAHGAGVDATPWESGAMAATLRGLRPDFVFSLLGTTQTRAKRARQEQGRDEGYEAVDYGLTMLLLEAVRASAGSARFVYLSALGVSESTRNPYLAVRARVERALREGTTPWIIVRPGFITGPDRDEFRPAERAAAIASDAILAVLGVLGARRLRRRYGSITNVALADALVRLALDPGAAGRIAGPEDLR